jgi:hypothetical protein
MIKGIKMPKEKELEDINLEIFFKEIGEKIKEGIKNHYPIMRKRFENEKPYAVVFETDSECMTLSLIVNTYEHLEKTDAKYGHGDGDTTKWFPGEWGYWDDPINSGLSEISDELYKKLKSIWDIAHGQVKKQALDITNEQEFELAEPLIEEYRFTEHFLETVTVVFLELIQSNVFCFDTDEVTYFISMSDDDRAEEIENNSARVLNSKAVYEKFLKRFDSE